MSVGRHAPRVLLVEDSKPCQDLVRIVLEKQGCTVDIAWNGEEAIEALAKTDYSLVLMDCCMPGLSGLDTTKRIRDGSANARNPAIPIIAITADVLRTNFDACKLAGMSDFVTKPVRLAALRRIVYTWIGGCQCPEHIGNGARPDLPAGSS